MEWSGHQGHDRAPRLETTTTQRCSWAGQSGPPSTRLGPARNGDTFAPGILRSSSVRDGLSIPTVHRWTLGAGNGAMNRLTPCGGVQNVTRGMCTTHGLVWARQRVRPLRHGHCPDGDRCRSRDRNPDASWLPDTLHRQHDAAGDTLRVVTMTAVLTKVSSRLLVRATVTSAL